MMHGYIDESGVCADQQVMTLALVLFEGKRSADNLHQRLTTDAHPVRNDKRKSYAKKRRGEPARLHYCDMDGQQRLDVADRLSRSDIRAYLASHWFDGQPKDHDDLCGLYCAMLEAVVNSALNDMDKASVLIGRRGGACIHQPQLIRRLEELRHEHSRRAGYKEINFSFGGNHSKGIQIADFYAGVIRDQLRGLDQLAAAAADLLECQVRDHQSVTSQSIKSVVISEEAGFASRLF